MYLVLANDNEVLSYGNDSDVIILDSSCELKYLDKINYDLFLFDSIVTDEGFIKEYKIVLDEIFLSVNIKNVFTNVYSLKLEEICKYYNCNLFILKKGC